MGLRRAVVTGFGPWGDRTTNPAAKLATLLDGSALDVGGSKISVVGKMIPTAYEAGIEQTLQLVRAHDPILLLGLGVNSNATVPEVEKYGRRGFSDSVDVNGQVGAPDSFVRGKREVKSRINDKKLARAIGGKQASDAGKFVCNAWLHQITTRSEVLSGFVHLPQTGLDPRTMLKGIGVLVADALGVDEDSVKITG